jgi:hypothetical protein
VHWHSGGVWHVMGFLGYGTVFTHTIWSGIHPGPRDSRRKLDRLIRVAGGLFVLLFFLLCFFLAPSPK